MKISKQPFNKKLIYTPKFAYLFGYFAADGSFYKDSSGERFEFVDGFSIKNEQFYSIEFMEKIQQIIFELFKIKSKIRKKQNKYIISFRNKKLANLFKKELRQGTGEKSKTVNLPKIYPKTTLEKCFWLGFLDGDGCVPRYGRKIALESASKKLIISFKSFLNQNQIHSNYYERVIKNQTYYGVRITSAFFTQYAKILGFSHPRKKKWLTRSIQKEFYVSNKLTIDKYLFQKDYINYLKIFDSKKVYLINSKQLIEKYGCKCDHRKNRTLNEITKTLISKGMSTKRILEILTTYYWKMGKGSNNPIKLPLKPSSKLELITKFVRTRNGGITFSKQYINAFKENPRSIIKSCEDLFGIKPKWTTKQEPIFCSGVLNLLFSKIVSRTSKA